MKIKRGVIMPDKLEMRPVLIHAERIWKEFNQELVITCGKDGTHSAGSLHYYGYAIDLRTRYFLKKATKLSVKNALKNALGSKYDVILHDTHIHVEYDHIIKDL